MASSNSGEMREDVNRSFNMENNSADSSLTASLLISEDEAVQDDDALVIGGDDFAIDLMERDDSDDLFLYREGRTVGYCVHVLQWCLFAILLMTCLPVMYVYSKTIPRPCDLHLKIWSLVWLSRAVLQTSLNLVITRQRLTRQPVPHGIFFIVRFLHMLGIAWAFSGVYIIFYRPHCEGDATQQFSLIISKAMFWFTAAVIIVPIALYILLLLCLPLLIYFLVRFSVPHADRQPTPPDVLSQLEVKNFRDVVAGLRNQYNIEPLPRAVSSTITNVLDNVSALLVAPAVDSAVVEEMDDAGGAYRDLRDSRRMEKDDSKGEEPRPATITINRACPICMVDMDDGDEVMVMPCDARHFFHKTCVEQWLEGSQACPICRANIVTLLTGTPPQEATAGGASTSIEMRS
eukprot:GHVS01083426.1.p1 GENE.GHVS01083426.1~~GHVS01083426.1.p1  ORF type:complete len:404 (+),score=66.30 GHVS01083426.1:352-1563(+)